MDNIEGRGRDTLLEGGIFGLLGASPAIESLRMAITKVANADGPVLITGEIGTGKERVARLIHQQSNRSSGPFVCIRGAAVTALDPGAAGGGTLFIHEVGDLTAGAQTALLLFLQHDVGEGSEPSTRLLASTHSDLQRKTLGGHFRGDLYYRLNSLILGVPPLRERGPDVGLLAQHFLGKFAGSRDLALDAPALRQMLAHTWPGNVRELRNRVLQATTMCEGKHLTAELLGLADVASHPCQPAGSGMSLRETRHIAEREAITQALRGSNGQVPAAAAALGISRAQLYRLIGSLHIEHQLAHDPDQNGISSSGKGSSLRAAGVVEPDPLRSPP